MAEVPAGSRKRRERECAIATPTTTTTLSPPTNDSRVPEKLGKIFCLVKNDAVENRVKLC